MEVPVERFVSLARRPEGLRFPADLADRISYEEARQRLVYRGFMSKADFDRLSRLSDDWAYRRGLEDLFRLCLPSSPKRPFFVRLASSFGFGT